MSFSRSRSLFHERAALFRLIEHHSNTSRLGARFVPATACSTAHVGRRSNSWNHYSVTPWTDKFRWGWGWDSARWNAGVNGVRPAIDMREKADAYLIEADLPGVKKGDLSVSVGDDGWSLIVEGRRSTASGSAEKVEEKDAQDATLKNGEMEALVFERADTFERKVWFSQMVDGRCVQAKLEDGVLKLHVPKKMGGDGSVRVEVA